MILRNGLIDRLYRPDDFPWIEAQLGSPVPADSIAAEHGVALGAISEMEGCEPETRLSCSGARKVEALSEQVLVQQGGYATVLLHAELADID